MIIFGNTKINCPTFIDRNFCAINPLISKTLMEENECKISKKKINNFSWSKIQKNYHKNPSIIFSEIERKVLQYFVGKTSGKYFIESDLW